MRSLTFENAKWIWTGPCPKNDEYGEFYSDFDYTGGELSLLISADSNYAVYMNGTLALFGQYADYPHDKVYDFADITKYAREGKNSLAIVVWYIGTPNSQTYYHGNAGLLYELFQNGASISHSSEKTLSRMSLSYKNHYEKEITSQLSYSFLYDISLEDPWMLGKCSGFSDSTVVLQKLPLRIRPNKKLELLAPVYAKPIKCLTPCKIIYDLGVNLAGFIKLECKSSVKQKLTVAYGEHISDGCVRRILPWRDFSTEFILREGENAYMNPFRRLGAKYLEIESEEPLDEIKLWLVPTEYPLTDMKKPPLTKGEEEIYDICVRTLRNCMHEHYEDCSWREQALYCMDSRNQMLSGYYAFGEYEFPRSNLELIAGDDRQDGLLSICYPSSRDLVIPSFSLHYFTECHEYLEYSGDRSLINRIYPKLLSVLETFTSRLDSECGLIYPFEGASYWNFYEWRYGLDGDTKLDIREPDLLLNALLSKALAHFAKTTEAIGLDGSKYIGMQKLLNENINKHFFSAEKGLYLDRVGTPSASVLGNSLAILAGCADESFAKEILPRLWEDKSLTEISLSMQCFLFDASLIYGERAVYAKKILDRIEEIYRPMVDLGVGTVWETEVGESDFGNAASLCHGWSALPVYYYHILKTKDYSIGTH